MSSDDASGRDAAPPPGFEVMTSRKLDPLFGVSGRWAYRGQIGTQTLIRTGLPSRAAACRAAWGAVDDG